MRTKAHLKNLKNVKCTRVYHSRWHSENINEFKNFLIEELSNNIEGFKPEDLKESSDSFSYSNRIWIKSKLKPITIGLITFRSNDYIFEHDGLKSYGVPASKWFLTSTGFYIIDVKMDKIEYIIEEA